MPKTLLMPCSRARPSTTSVVPSLLPRSVDVGYRCHVAWFLRLQCYLYVILLTGQALKYPDMEDYMRALIDLDKKEVMSNHLMMVDQRNNMAIVHDSGMGFFLFLFRVVDLP